MEQSRLDKNSTKCSEFSRLRKALCRSGGVNTLLMRNIEVLNRTCRSWRISLHSDSSRILISTTSGRSLNLATDRICIPFISTPMRNRPVTVETVEVDSTVTHHAETCDTIKI